MHTTKELDLANQENDEEARKKGEVSFDGPFMIMTDLDGPTRGQERRVNLPQLTSPIPDLMSPLTPKRQPHYAFGPKPNNPVTFRVSSGADFRFYSDGVELGYCQAVELTVNQHDFIGTKVSTRFDPVKGSLVFLLSDGTTPAKLVAQLGSTLVIKATTETAPEWEILSLEAVRVTYWNLEASIDDLVLEVKVHFAGVLKREEQ